jgi:hypothetical protein
MALKSKKTTAELTAFIMAEIRKHPECDHVTSVRIQPLPQNSSRDRNWAVFWKFDGPKLQPRIADDIAQKLQNQFDLI